MPYALFHVYANILVSQPSAALLNVAAASFLSIAVVWMTEQATYGWKPGVSLHGPLASSTLGCHPFFFYRSWFRHIVLKRNFISFLFERFFHTNSHAGHFPIADFVVGATIRDAVRYRAFTTAAFTLDALAPGAPRFGSIFHGDGAAASSRYSAANKPASGPGNSDEDTDKKKRDKEIYETAKLNYLKLAL